MSKFFILSDFFDVSSSIFSNSYLLIPSLSCEKSLFRKSLSSLWISFDFNCLMKVSFESAVKFLNSYQKE